MAVSRNDESQIDVEKTKKAFGSFLINIQTRPLYCEEKVLWTHKVKIELFGCNEEITFGEKWCTIKWKPNLCPAVKHQGGSVSADQCQREHLTHFNWSILINLFRFYILFLVWLKRLFFLMAFSLILAYWQHCSLMCKFCPSLSDKLN